MFEQRHLFYANVFIVLLHSENMGVDISFVIFTCLVLEIFEIIVF